ncbi:ATP-dependent endonuclease [Geodermatophilus sp. DSM 45219]|uniref:ATP-dependent nuclease n=1 Tax=Geodermatophilus sp. DSM 45219 TaxID=1881103 RepID=UPI000891DA32|nr:AAA family ATPase [Geodermatophilus sp. DSM 45219]SDO16589.1 putative ATP-dependent endonuclease of the OLD family [Geodermatophilus sp. DSM 45219]
MQLTRMRMSGFRSVGPEPVEISYERLTFLLGPNGTGKTAFLQALARMFGFEPSLRRVVAGDFHVSRGETPGAGTARTLWLEADFAFPELDEDAPQPTVPPHFTHMRMESVDGVPTVRFRLTAELDEDGEINQELAHVLAVGDDDEPIRLAAVNRYDRGAIQVHYLPARRDPADHVSYAANSLLGRLLRAADWQSQRDTVTGLGEQISEALAANAAIADVTSGLATQWRSMHTGAFLTNPRLSFVRSEIEGILRYVTLEFAPGHGEPIVDFSLLSDGQMSLLYISLVLAAQSIGREALAGRLTTFDLGRLRPPVFTLLAVEEPENSLSPHYLGRVLAALSRMADGNDAQAVVATHSPSLMRRVEPAQVRYLRLDEQRLTTVSSVTMPEKADEAHKFVREALHAYPELYFARLVVLGEGDSEEVVLPRCLQAAALDADTTAISVVPLGGRHVNHFWRLLHGLGIPHVTLLDLDLGRYQGGWGRLKYAADQLLLYSPSGSRVTQAHADAIAKAAKEGKSLRSETGRKAVKFLEEHGVFFSNPLDLDFSMLQLLPEAYGLEADDRQPPTSEDIKSVLGKKGDAVGYDEEEKRLFGAYHQRFKLGSKPAEHLAALAQLDDETLSTSMPEPIRRLIVLVDIELLGIPE